MFILLDTPARHRYPATQGSETKALPLISEGVSLIAHRKVSRSMSLRAPLMMKAFVVRFVFFLSVWFMIAGWKEEDLPVGLCASALALWISLTLLPPTAARPRFAPLSKLSFRFLSCSITAGVDVAWRALLPRLDLHPGFVAVPLALPPGAARSAFLVYSSLQPGTLPTSAEGEMLQVHCLDTSQPVAAVIVEDEALFKEAVGHE
jgi:multicomponent Na+:H+ antiporter subunit E